MEQGKVRVLVFEISGSDETLQEAFRVVGNTFNPGTDSGTDSLTVAARNEVVAPVAAIAPGRAELAAVHVARRAKARLNAPKDGIDCVPAGKGSGTPSPVQDLCMEALKVRAFHTTGVHNWAQKRLGKDIPIGSVYSALSALKGKGVVKCGDDPDGNRVWSLVG